MSGAPKVVYAGRLMRGVGIVSIIWVLALIAAAGQARYAGTLDEAKLTAQILGVSAFSKTFGAAGPRDRRGRSLRELDLQTRLFKYRCSYMIYSPAFDALPAEARLAVLVQMRERLTDTDTLAILDETKSGWR